MIILTPQAGEKVRQLIQNEGSNYLRIFAQGGGCSGLQYGMSLDKEKLENDIEFKSEEVRIIVDPISIRYLDGTEVGWDEAGVLGGQFQMKNPNAKGSCGCGHSFEPR